MSLFHRSIHATTAGLAGLVVLFASACSTAPAGMPTTAPTTVAGSDDRQCDSNRDYGMTGVVHASTKRELDDCRRSASRP